MGGQHSLFRGEVLSEQDIESLVSPLHADLFSIINEPFARFLEFRQSHAEFRVLDEGESAQFFCDRRL
ncbi:MAG TPA: hypothetical protein PKC18_16790 [Lacipirellulaceae bacterium]|nr:hypothetical protein [Lacipirellulaceae bacterium]